MRLPTLPPIHASYIDINLTSTSDGKLEIVLAPRYPARLRRRNRNLKQEPIMNPSKQQPQHPLWLTRHEDHSSAHIVPGLRASEPPRLSAGPAGPVATTAGPAV